MNEMSYASTRVVKNIVRVQFLTGVTRAGYWSNLRIPKYRYLTSRLRLVLPLMDGVDLRTPT